MGEIKSIQLISNNICYGPAPASTDEGEQHLTISSSGRIWFSARNYKQYCVTSGFCRKKQMNIGSWKANYLLRLIERIREMDWATDCGDYDLSIRFDSGEIKHIYGSLAEDVMTTSYGDVQISLSKIMRRYIPVYALWGFSGDLSPDYEGKKEIFLFAQKWEDAFRSPNLSVYEFEKSFGDSCIELGFQMDCGKEFERLYPGCFNLHGDVLRSKIEDILDIDLLGAAVFSQWRYLTHWAYSLELDLDTCKWFSLTLGRMKELTKKRP